MSEAEARVSIFGISIDPLTMGDTVEKIAGWARSDDRSCKYVVTPNVDHVVKLSEKGSFSDAYEKASLVVVDGKPVVAAARLLGKPIPETVPGSDLVPALFEWFECDKGQPVRVFLLGAAAGVADRAAQNIHARWSGVQVVGTLSPRFGFETDADECAAICQAVNAAQAEVLVIGLGAPKQEVWIAKYSAALSVNVALCVGATIDFLAGEKRRAPVWVRKLALEWLYRMLSEPRRLAGRYMRDTAIFPRLVLGEWRRRT